MSEPDSICQLKLSLCGSRPEVWRRMLAPSDFTLGDLHYLILYAFCWFDDRPHEFRVAEAGEGRQPGGHHGRNEHGALLANLFPSPGAQLEYRCQSGDRWVVSVSLERKRAPSQGCHYPCCIGGAHDGPPNGVGGVARYNELVSAFARPGPWRAMFSQRRPSWLSPFFDPTDFDIGLINGLMGLVFPSEPSSTDAGVSAPRAHAHGAHLEEAPPTRPPRATCRRLRRRSCGP